MRAASAPRAAVSESMTAERRRAAARNAVAKLLASHDRAAKEATRKGLAVGSCPAGTILRRAHYRRAGAAATGKRPGKNGAFETRLVPPSCVPDPLEGKRKPGEIGSGGTPRGLLDRDGRRVVIRVEPGRLEKHGYKLARPERVRRGALRKAIESEGVASWLSIFRRLVLLSTWNKRKSPDNSARAKADAEYVKKKYRVPPANKHRNSK